MLFADLIPKRIGLNKPVPLALMLIGSMMFLIWLFKQMCIRDSLLDYMGAYAYGFPLDEETRRGLIFRGHVMNLYGSITLNKAGKRFINDDQNSTKVAQFLASRHERTVYQLATEAQLSDFMKNDPIQVIGWDRTKFNQEKEEGGHFINKVNSLEECASEMGGSFDTLKNTIDAYNRSVASGNDGEFGRKFMKGQFLSGPFICSNARRSSGLLSEDLSLIHISTRKQTKF